MVTCLNHRGTYKFVPAVFDFMYILRKFQLLKCHWMLINFKAKLTSPLIFPLSEPHILVIKHCNIKAYGTIKMQLYVSDPSS